MDVTELVNRKALMESRIEEFINAEVKKFEEESTLLISNVVPFTHRKEGRFHVYAVEATLSL